MPIDQAPNTEANAARLFGSLAVMTMGVAATLATVLGFFGSAWWVFDILAGFRLQLALLLVVVAAGFRIGFGMATGALFLAAAITNVIIVAPLFLGSQPAAGADNARLTIASVPVDETGKEEAMAWVAESDVDIAFLVDTDDTWSDVAPTPGSGYVVVDQVFIGRQTGMTIVAKRGITLDIVGLENTNTPVIRAATTVGTRDIVIYAMLLRAPDSDTEAKQRNALLERIASRIVEETVPVAVIGDLGISQWSHSFRIIAEKADLTDSSSGSGFQGSTPGGAFILFRVPTSHLMTTTDLTVTERHLGPDLGHGRTIFQGTVAFAAG